MSLLIVVAVIVFIAIAIGSMYNRMVALRVQCDNAWSQIDVQLKRRHDLIPNLVETVKGYAAHEKETLERVVNARNAAVQVSGQGASAQAGAESMLTGALRQLFALSESYPDLKANQNFLALQEELSSTENRIGFARQHYNDSVGSYQQTIQSFPSNLIAGWFQFLPRSFFEIDPGEAAAVKAAPQVKF